MTWKQKKVATKGIGHGSSKLGTGSKMNSKTANILKKKNKKQPLLNSFDHSAGTLINL